MAAGAFARALGTVYRIIIVRMAGTEALGLFQMTVPVLRAASTMATLRLPTALTRLTADRLAQGDTRGVLQARTITAFCIVALTAATSAAMVALAPALARRLFTDPRILPLLYVLPLAVVPSALTGIFRGFAEGRQIMTGTAAGQVAEPVIRLAAAALLLRLWGPHGVVHAALALVVGYGIGELAGLLAAAAFSGWRSFPNPGAAGTAPSRCAPPGPGGPAAPGSLAAGRELFAVALPLWATTMVNTAAQMINVSLIPRRLMAAGFSVREATELYGQLTGMVIPLLYMPMVAVFPVSTILTPAIAAHVAGAGRGRARRQFLQATVGALGVGAAASAAFALFPEPLARILYGEPQIAPLIALAAAAPPLVYTSSIFASVLQALGKTDVLLGHFLAATALRLALIYYLTADPSLGIAGALWALNADYALTALLNGRAAWRLLGSRGRPA